MKASLALTFLPPLLPRFSIGSRSSLSYRRQVHVDLYFLSLTRIMSATED